MNFRSFFGTPCISLPKRVINFSTGQPTKYQVVSVVFSTLCLTLSACDAFYVQRSPDFADPEPTVHMTLRVFLYMLIQVSQSTPDVMH